VVLTYLVRKKYYTHSFIICVSEFFISVSKWLKRFNLNTIILLLNDTHVYIKCFTLAELFINVYIFNNYINYIIASPSYEIDNNNNKIIRIN